jgi:ADP-ribose pyrophosphatase YjhB (NUDIX family)
MEQKIKQIENTARGIIVDDGKLLVFRLDKADDWYCLPGGKIEFGENIERAMTRELFEETGIKAKIGKLLLVNEMILPNKHRIEFFYHVENGSDYRSIDLAKTSHGFEIAETLFVDPTTTDKTIYPTLLRKVIPELIGVGPDNFKFRVVTDEPTESKK